ncbi:hypothetical protein D3C78_1554170 [compost metagenome]
MCITGQVAAFDFELEALPFGAAFFEFLIANKKIHRTVIHINLDDIAVLYEGNRTALRSFRRYVTDTNTAGCTGEPAICNKSYLRAQTHTYNLRGWSKHLRHTRAAARSFITNDDDMAFLDLAISNAGKSIIL